MKRSSLISCFVTCSLLLQSTIGIASAAFPDVHDGHPHKKAISWVESEGIVKGYEDGTFLPNKVINRAEFTKIIMETIGGNLTGHSCFSDIGTEWYSAYICSAKQQGIINGYPDGTFDPGGSINFAEAAKIIVNALDLERGTGDDAWYEPFIEGLEKKRAIPYEIYSFGQELTRGQMAELIYRVNNDDHTGDTRTFVALSGIPEEVVLDNGSLMLQGGPIFDATYETYSEEAYASLLGTTPFVLNFYAPWCPTCRKIKSDMMEDLGSYPKGVVILEVDFDSSTELKSQYGVTSQTTFVFLDESGMVKDQYVAITANQVAESLREFYEE